MAGSTQPLLLDTSIVVASFRNDAAILTRLSGAQIVVTSTVLGELYYGARRASRAAQQMTLIAGLIHKSTILVCDQKTAEYYSEIKHELRLQGLLIPDNDTWIAASALQYRLPLAARDGHFERIQGLVVEQW
jgi:tRNA(fMet)-specific endonuclease VapC